MATYNVVIEIEVDADSPFDAAKLVEYYIKSGKQNFAQNYYLKNIDNGDLFEVNVSEKKENAVLPIDSDSFNEYDLPELTYDRFIETTSTLYQITDIIEKYLLMNEREVYTRTKRSDIKNWLILNS